MLKIVLTWLLTWYCPININSYIQTNLDLEEGKPYDMNICFSPCLFFFVPWEFISSCWLFTTWNHNHLFVTSQLVTVKMISVSQTDDYDFRWWTNSRSRWTPKEQSSWFHAKVQSNKWVREEKQVFSNKRFSMVLDFHMNISDVDWI